MIFAYKARDASGKGRSGTLEERSLGEAAETLARRGLQVLELSPVTPTVATPRPPLTQTYPWLPKVGAGVGALLLLIGLARLPRLLSRPSPMEITLSGSVKGGNDHLEIYVSFPDQNRTIRQDGREYELIGGRLAPGRLAQWIPKVDAAAHYEDQWKDEQFEIKVSLGLRDLPKNCRVTVRKPGYLAARSPLVNLSGTGSHSASGTVPALALRLDRRGVGREGRLLLAPPTAKPSVEVDRHEGPGEEKVPLED